MQYTLNIATILANTAVLHIMFKPKTVTDTLLGIFYCEVTHLDKICLEYDYSNYLFPTWFKTTIQQHKLLWKKPYWHEVRTDALWKFKVLRKITLFLRDTEPCSHTRCYTKWKLMNAHMWKPQPKLRKAIFLTVVPALLRGKTKLMIALKNMPDLKTTLKGWQIPNLICHLQCGLQGWAHLYCFLPLSHLCASKQHPETQSVMKGRDLEKIQSSSWA